MIENISGILGTFFFVLSVTFRWIVVKNNDLSGLFLAFCMSAWFIPVMLFIIDKLPYGYILEKDGIVFNCMFKKNKLLFENIKYIIIVNAKFRLKITKTPWVGMFGQHQDEFLQYLLYDKKRHVLTSDNIKCYLGEKIGHYDAENLYKIFKKGSSTVYNYGFVWNKKEIHKIFEGFKGDYYIAASVISNHNDEFNAICKQYKIDTQRIHIIDDSTNGEFIWQ